MCSRGSLEITKPRPLCYKTLRGNKKLCITISQNVSYYPSLMISGKARSLPFDWNAIRGSTLVGSNFACKYQIRVNISDSEKHSSLLLQRTNFAHKNVYDKGSKVSCCAGKHTCLPGMGLKASLEGCYSASTQSIRLG